MSIITLLSDFGLKDHFVGMTKALLYSANKNHIIIDISHEVDCFNILEAAYLIEASFSHFPEETIHLILVDSEFTPSNNCLLMKWNNQFFIGANNGIFSLLNQRKQAEIIVEIENTSTFYINTFIQTAQSVIEGKSIDSLGKLFTNLLAINPLNYQLLNQNSTLKGSVIYIDHFGNCVTNITQEIFEKHINSNTFELKFGGQIIKRIHKTYDDFNVTEKFTLKHFEGEKLAIFNQAGYLEIAIYKSNPKTVGTAKTLLGLKYRDTITIDIK